MGIKGLGMKGNDSINWAQDVKKKHALVNAVMNLLIIHDTTNFLSS